MGVLKRTIGRLPLRVRLTVWVVWIAALIQLAVGAVFYLYQRDAVERFFGEHLKVRTDGMIDDLRLRGASVSTIELITLAEQQAWFSMFSGFLISVYDAEGALLATTREDPLESVAPDELRWMASSRAMEIKVVRAGETRRFDPEAKWARRVMRGYMGIDGKRYVLIASTPDTYAQRMLDLVMRALLVAFPSGVVVAGISGWVMARLAVQPLQSVRAAASRMTAESIGAQRVILPRSSPEQEELERELNAAMDRLSAAFATQERFMSNVSHELKTPIAVILTEAQTLDLRAATEEYKLFVRSTTDELRRLGTMVDSFLLLTRVRDGRAPSETATRPCGLNDVVMESVSGCAPMAAQHGVRLAPRLYDGDAGDEVCGDPALLRTMIDNLVRNAIRFSPMHSAVNIDVERERKMMVVRVRDHGPGIPEQLIGRIFDRFIQAPDEHRRGRGHGLGLEIAQGIAELHGGRIEAQNCYERDGEGEPRRVVGCQFIARLPRASQGDGGCDNPEPNAA